jgi:hypothetical protein
LSGVSYSSVFLRNPGNPKTCENGGGVEAIAQKKKKDIDENKSATTEKRIAEQRKQKNEFDRAEKNCMKTPRCDLIIGLIFKGNYMQELLRK